MSDEWARPESAQVESQRFEVPLVGADAPPGDDGAPHAPDGTNWRKVVALASIGGAILGVLVAVVALTVLDDGAETEPTLPEEQLDDLASTITAPPTLPPITTTAPVRTDPPPNQSPPSTSLPDRPPDVPVADLTLITVPTFVPVVGTELAPVDLGSAVAGLDTDLPRRSTTRFQWTSNDRPIDLEIVRDPTTDRARLTIADPDFEATAIVDLANDAVYADAGAMGLDDPEQWVRFTSERFLSGSGYGDLRQFLRIHLLGPVRTDTIATADVVDSGVDVELDGGGTARQFLVAIASAEVADWITFAFGPDGGRSVDDSVVSSTTTFDTYVDRSGSLALVTNRLLLDGWAQGFTHRIETLAEPITIDLPDPTVVIAP